jgi:two-component system, LuxR family, response regulator FixJ
MVPSPNSQYATDAVVYILDDDDLSLWTLQNIVESIGVKVVTYHSAKDFLQEYHPYPCECVVSDVRMPEIGGLQLQRQLISTGSPPPIIFVTGHSEITAAVEAMRAGAFDFIEKPVNGHLLIEKIQNALTHSRDLHKERMARTARQARLALLTPKEKDIIDLVVQGKSSREIASAFDLSVRTVENHRARIMEKLHISSAVELVKMFA